MKQRVLLIDPWGVNNTSEYLNGLIYGLSELVDLDVFTNEYFELKKLDAYCNIHRVFFKKSEHMAPGKKRSILRGVEYVKAYNRILHHLKTKGPYDVVHINWLLFYPLDIRFLKQIKKYCKALVYTAHNVLPHENGEKQKDNLKKIYQTVDRIILHGDNIRKEFEEYFPEEAEKVFIQNHGANLIPNINYDETIIPEKIKAQISRYERRYICFGNMFYNKGADRLIKIWTQNQMLDSTLLIVAGRVSDEYKELLELVGQKRENILMLNQYLDDSLLNYLIDQSDLILLPYRHASMSGVIFTAADFKKAVLATKVGAIEEYVTDGQTSILVTNTDTGLEQAILRTIDMKKQDLQEMGERLYLDIQRTCGWKQLTKTVVDHCY